MQSTQLPTFNILNYVESLTQIKRGRYVCPNCNEPDLGIASSGKYQCFKCHDTKAIARILTEPEREEQRRQKESERIANSKTPQERIDEWVNGSAVSQSITDANIKHIEDKPLIASLLGWKWYSHTPGWYVLSCDPITGKRGKDGQFKPDSPIKFPDNDDPQKYISFPKGSKNSAIYLSLTLDDWIQISDKFGVAIADADIDEGRDDLGFWRWVLDHPELPITFTEGAKKAGCLLSHGWIAISISGVWNGQVGKGRKLHPSIEPFIVPGRRIYTAFDSDVLHNPNVEAALRQLGHLIRREKAETFICSWDEEKGIDDLIVRHGVEILDSLQEQALPYSEWLKSLQPLQPTSDSGGNSGGGDGSDSGGGNGGDGNGGDEDNHPEAFYRYICKNRGLDFENCVTSQTFDGWAYRQQFGANEGDWRVIDSAFYHWDERLGYWQHKPDNKINALIADFGEQAFKLKHSKEFGWQVTKPYELNSHKESAFKYCRSRLERSGELPANTHLRAFKNCVVDMRSGQKMPHDKAHFLTSTIPYDYEPGKECPEVFRQFVADSFGEDMLDVIRAFTSMFLDCTAPYGRVPHLIGQSGGGKGTMGRFWNSLFGEDGASSGDFANLSTAEGRHQYLTGKSIFSIPDAGGYVSGLRAFYELVDNGGMSGRALFNPVGYFKTWNCRFWIASVDHLQVENAGDGWARRVYPIPVRPRTVRPDPDLRLKLEACKADVISWALAMPRAERDRILLSPPTNERVINLTLDSALYGDSTKSFVDLCLRPNPEAGFIPNHLLHSWYVAYCQQHGYTPLGMSKFISHLKTVLPRNFADRGWSPMVDGKRSRVPAHWEFMAPLPNAFVKSDVEVETNPFDGRQEKNNPTWVCIKSACEEGGLMDFEDFWQPPQPPQPPKNFCDNNLIGEQPPLPPSSPQEPPEIVQGVQGGTDFAELLKQRNSGGVQGGSTVHPIGSGMKKNAVCVLEKIEARNEVNFSLTSVTEGGQIERRVDSSNLGHTAVENQPCDNLAIVVKAKKPLTLPMLVKVLEAVQSVEALEEVEQQASDEGFDEKIWKPAVWKHLSSDAQARLKSLSDMRKQREVDPWMSEENLDAIASALTDCPDQETLAVLRECWPGYAMNSACKRLSPEKHVQVKQWVLALNADKEELLEPIQAELFAGVREQAQIAPGDWSWE